MRWTVYAFLSALVHALALTFPFHSSTGSGDPSPPVVFSVELAREKRMAENANAKHQANAPAPKVEGPSSSKTEGKRTSIVKTDPATRELPVPSENHPREHRSTRPPEESRVRLASVEEPALPPLEDDGFAPELIEDRQQPQHQATANVRKEKERVGAEGALSSLPLISPRYSRTPKPVYPHSARKNGWEGTVVLRVLVNPKGMPEEIEISEGSGFSSLDGAAVQGVRRWRFHPAKRGGKPMESWVKVPIVFRLTESK